MKQSIRGESTAKRRGDDLQAQAVTVAVVVN